MDKHIEVLVDSVGKRDYTAKLGQPKFEIFLEDLWSSKILRSTTLFFPEFNLIKSGVILFGDYLQEYNKKNKDYDKLYYSLELSLVSIFIGLETSLNKLLYEKRKKLKTSKSKKRLVTRDANLHEMLNILGENSFIWQEKKIDKELLNSIRSSYNLNRIKIIHPNAKVKNKRMFYPYNQMEYTNVFYYTIFLLEKIYHHSSLERRNWIKKLEDIVGLFRALSRGLSTEMTID